MRKEDWIKVILVLSLSGNLALFINHKRVSRDQELRYELLNAYISRDLTQLEATIQYQLDNNWVNEPLVTQKLDDAIDSVLLHIGMETNDEKEDTLWELYDYLKKFKIGDETLSVSLTDKQKTNFNSLGEKLRSYGWTYGAGYDNEWDVFETMVKGLLTES